MGLPWSLLYLGSNSAEWTQAPGLSSLHNPATAHLSACSMPTSCPLASDPGTQGSGLFPNLSYNKTHSEK